MRKPTAGTKVMGQIHSTYVQTDVPVKYSLDVCETLSKMILADYYRAFCTKTETDDDNQ